MDTLHGAYTRHPGTVGTTAEGSHGRELADELNLSGKTIFEQASKGHIPYYKIAGSIRFDPVRIAGWLRLQEAA